MLFVLDSIQPFLAGAETVEIYGGVMIMNNYGDVDGKWLISLCRRH